MAGLKRARLCKGTLPVSNFLTLPVLRPLPGWFLPAQADNPTVSFPFPHPRLGFPHVREEFPQVDRGDGKGYVLLTVDTTPNYVDTQPFPAAKAV